MNIVLEILSALAAVASIGEFLLGLWGKYKAQQQMKSEETKEPGGNQAL